MKLDDTVKITILKTEYLRYPTICQRLWMEFGCFSLIWIYTKLKGLRK